MAIPLVLGAAKLLGGTAARSAAMQGAKKLATNAAKKKAKNFITGKGKKKKGALVKKGRLGESEQQKSGALVATTKPSSALVPTDVPSTTDITKAEVAESKDKVDYSSLSERINSIVSLTDSLAKAAKNDLKQERSRDKNLRANIEKEKKEKREAKLESKGFLGAIAGAATSAAKKFNILDFFKYMLLGSLVLNLMNLINQIPKMFNTLMENLYLIFHGIRAALVLLRAVKSIPKNLFKGARALIRGTFSLIGKGIRAIGSGIARGIRNIGRFIINRLRALFGLKPLDPDMGSGKGKGKPKTGKLDKKTKKTLKDKERKRRVEAEKKKSREKKAREKAARESKKQQAKQKQTKVKPPKPPAPTSLDPKAAPAKAPSVPKPGEGVKPKPKTTEVKAPKPKAPTAAQVKPKPIKPATNNLLQKIFGITDKKDVEALRKAKRPLGKARGFVKAARIPILGPLIVFITDALDPDISMGEAAFAAIGTGIGELLGTLIPIPILGTMIGGLAGEFGGRIAYDLIIQKSPEAAMQRVQQAWDSAVNMGSKAWDWISGGFGKFNDSLDKYQFDFGWFAELPMWVKAGIPGFGLLGELNGVSIPQPEQFLKMFQGDFTVGSKLLNSFFNKDFNEKGIVEIIGGDGSGIKDPDDIIENMSSQQANDRLAEVKSKEGDFRTLVGSRDEGEVLIKGVGKVVTKMEGGRSKTLRTRYYDENGKEITYQQFNDKLAEVKSNLQTQKTSGPTVAPSTGGAVNPNLQASNPSGYVSNLMPKQKASQFYNAMGINENIYKTYKDTIASIETSGYSLENSYKAIGGSGDSFDGRYQMGVMARKDAAAALGIPTPTRAELRSNPQLQEDMFLAYTYKNFTYMSGKSSEFDNADAIQKMQFLGYAHNQGHTYATDWLKTGVISSTDGFGTKGTKFTDKLAKTLAPYRSGSQPTSPSTATVVQQPPATQPAEGVVPLGPFLEGMQPNQTTPPNQTTQQQQDPAVKKDLTGMTVSPQTQVVPSKGPKLGGLSGHSGSVSYGGQQQAKLSTSYSPFAQSDISSQGMKIISGKGYRASTASNHKGYDIPAVKGTPVYAYLPGKITMNRVASGYGNIVEWQDSIYGEKHLFAHLESPGPLSVGTEFPAGTMLAKTGDTGTPGSYHLHWEIGAQGSEKDPGEWVKTHPLKNVPASIPPSGSTTPSTTPPSSAVPPSSIQAAPRQSLTRADNVTGYASYEMPGGNNVVVVQQPQTGQQAPMVVGGSSGGGIIPISPSMSSILNSYHKQQLLSTLYKRG